MKIFGAKGRTSMIEFGGEGEVYVEGYLNALKVIDDSLEVGDVCLVFHNNDTYFAIYRLFESGAEPYRDDYISPLYSTGLTVYEGALRWHKCNINEPIFEH